MLGHWWRGSDERMASSLELCREPQASPMPLAAHVMSRWLCHQPWSGVLGGGLVCTRERQWQPD